MIKITKTCKPTFPHKGESMEKEMADADSQMLQIETLSNIKTNLKFSKFKEILKLEKYEQESKYF